MKTIPCYLATVELQITYEVQMWLKRKKKRAPERQLVVARMFLPPFDDFYLCHGTVQYREIIAGSI